MDCGWNSPGNTPKEKPRPPGGCVVLLCLSGLSLRSCARLCCWFQSFGLLLGKPGAANNFHLFPVSSLGPLLSVLISFLNSAKADHRRTENENEMETWEKSVLPEEDLRGNTIQFSPTYLHPAGECFRFSHLGKDTC